MLKLLLKDGIKQQMITKQQLAACSSYDWSLVACCKAKFSDAIHYIPHVTYDNEHSRA